MFYRTTIPINPVLRDYCSRSTNASIQRQLEKQDLERNTPTVADVAIRHTGISHLPWSISGLIALLSVCSLTFFWYNRHS